MKTYQTSRLSNEAKAFFNENGVHVKKYLGGEKNLSVDGSGEDVSVGETVSLKIAKYAKMKFHRPNGEQLRTLDIGTGMGHMVNGMLQEGLDAFGIEGYAPLCDRSICPKDRLLSADLTLELKDERLKKAFDFTTSFEVIEHVHRNHQDMFFRNMAYLSDFQLCSIHVDGWPGTNEKHCNIKHECCWLEYFRSKNIGYEVLGKSKIHTIDGAYKNDVAAGGGAIPQFVHEEFREHVWFGQWNEWQCSFFAILDFRGFQL